MPLRPSKEISRSSRHFKSGRVTSYELMIRQMRRQRRIVMGLAGLLLLLLAGMWPVYLSIAKWNLERNQQLARVALAGGDFSEARRRAQLILRENQTNYEMLKVLHAAMVGQNDPKAAELVPALARNPAGTPQSRLDGFREVCATLPLPSVFRNWLTLPEGDRKRADFLQAFVTRVIEQGMAADAEELLRQSPETARDPGLQILQARCWLQMGSPDGRIRAQKKIAELMEKGGSYALPAFRLLAQVPLDQFRSGYFMEISPWLERQPGATAADRLLGRIQQLDRFPAEKPRIVAEAVQSLGSREPLACARWLRGLGMPREALELGANVDPAEWAATKADLLSDLDLWAELENWLATTPAGMTKTDITTRRAIAAEKAGNPARSRSLWEIILREATAVKTSNVLLDVAAQTRAAGMEEMSREALLEAVKLKRGRLPFWNNLRTLVPWLREADRGDKLQILCQIMTEIDFTTPEPRLEALDLGHLLGTSDAAATFEQLDLLAKNYPKLTADPRYHEVRATVLLGEGKAKEALETLRDPRQNARASSPRRTLITSFAQAAQASPPPEAASFRETIQWRGLIREEREFFTQLLERQFAGDEAPASPADPALR